MENELFDQLAESMTQAVEIKKGDREPAKVTEYEMPDVKAIRTNLGLTQEEFAKGLSLSKDTVKSWEQGKRKNPSGLARKVLVAIERDPSLYAEISKY